MDSQVSMRNMCISADLFLKKKKMRFHILKTSWIEWRRSFYLNCFGCEKKNHGVASIISHSFVPKTVRTLFKCGDIFMKSFPLFITFCTKFYCKKSKWLLGKCIFSIIAILFPRKNVKLWTSILLQNQP